jgi:snRNA-activating protein complex subunit 3
MPCLSNEFPDESLVDGTFTGYDEPGPSRNPIGSGCVVVIEGVAYGDGSTETDYARLALPRNPT